MALIQVYVLSALIFLTAIYAQDCTYNFDNGNDVLFILDSSGSISTNNIELDVKPAIRTLIQKRMLIGPEEAYSRISFISFYKDTHYVYEISNFIVNPNLAVYESEYFAPGGLFNHKFRKTSEPVDETQDEKGFAEAIISARKIFVANTTNVATRPKILFLLTDFHFEAENGVTDLSRVIEVMGSLRQWVTSYNGTLNVYGMGIGNFFNRTNMDVILKAGNGRMDPCAGKDKNEWMEYLKDQPKLPVKSTFGPRRMFKSTSVCCLLCNNQNTPQMYANCSLQEFLSTFDIEDVQQGIVDLECKSSGILDECVQQTTTSQPTTASTLPFLPEGPEVPSTTVGGTPAGESDEEDEEEELSASDMKFSALMVVFGVVNLVLIIFFLLVCIYAHRLEAPKSSQQLERMSTKRDRPSSNIYNPSTLRPTGRPLSPPPDPPRALMPTRVAPPVPKPNQDNDSGIVNEGYSDENRDLVYGNQWVADDVRVNSEIEVQRRDSPGGVPLRIGSDRSAINRADSWATQWSDPHSDGYVKASRIDDVIPEENDHDGLDYQDIPDSDVTPIEDRGDYMNMTYMDALKVDAARRFSRIREWGRNIGNRYSRNMDTEGQSETQVRDPTGSLPMNALQTTIPIEKSTTIPPIIRNKPPSMFKKLLQRKSKNYENEFVIQDLHDRHQQHGPGSGQQDTGIDSELQRKLAARNKIIEESEEAIETAGSDYQNEDAIYKLRRERKGTLDYH